MKIMKSVPLSASADERDWSPLFTRKIILAVIIIGKLFLMQTKDYSEMEIITGVLIAVGYSAVKILQ